MGKTVSIKTPQRHGPPYNIEPVVVYKPGAFPAETLGYQLCVLDSLNHIMYTMMGNKIYDTPEAALAALGDRPLTYTEEGFDGGYPVPGFVAWCDYFASYVEPPSEPKNKEVDSEDRW